MLSGYSHGIYTVSLALSGTGNEIYIPAEDQSIYKYTLGNAASLNTPFIAAPEGDEEFSGAGINVNPQNGDIWVCYSEEISWNTVGKIVVFNAAGSRIKSIDCGNTAPQAVLFNN